MLQNRDKPVSTWGFLVAVELEEGLSPEKVVQKLGDALLWVEKVGDVSVESLGEIDVYEETSEVE